MTGGELKATVLPKSNQCDDAAKERPTDFKFKNLKKSLFLTGHDMF